MRHRAMVTIIMLGLWPALVMPTTDDTAAAVRSSLDARCDPVLLRGLPRPEVPLILAQHSSSCACPPLECPNGTVEPCSADCFMSEVPDCRCEAWCDADGDPQGSNVCECH